MAGAVEGLARKGGAFPLRSALGCGAAGVGRCVALAHCAVLMGLNGDLAKMWGGSNLAAQAAAGGTISIKFN